MLHYTIYVFNAYVILSSNVQLKLNLHKRQTWVGDMNYMTTNHLPHDPVSVFSTSL